MTPAASGKDLEFPLKDAAALADSDGFKARMYQAVSVQRPVVLEYLKSVRRDKPEATPEELLRELEKRYLATVTVSGTGVGASAAIPAVGIPLAVGLGVADLLFFYETSALYVLATTELHGIEVTDAERARPLVLGMLLGQKSQSKISGMVLSAAGVKTGLATKAATGAVSKALPAGWGEMLTQQLPDSALAPVSTVIAREALKATGKVGGRTVGKILPFGIGAVVGGVGSYTFGRDVVKAARGAFPTPPTGFPPALLEYEESMWESENPPRAVAAMRAAASRASELGESAWDSASSGASAIKNAAASGANAVSRKLRKNGD